MTIAAQDGRRWNRGREQAVIGTESVVASKPEVPGCIDEKTMLEDRPVGHEFWSAPGAEEVALAIEFHYGRCWNTAVADRRCLRRASVRHRHLPRPIDNPDVIVFVHMKRILGPRRFRLRGLSGAGDELTLAATAHIGRGGAEIMALMFAIPVSRNLATTKRCG